MKNIDILKEQLKQHKSSFNELSTKLVEVDPKGSFILWSSYFEGLGTRSSDIDIYHVIEGKKERRSAETVKINNMILDIEKIEIENLLETIERLGKFSLTNELDPFISMAKLKILYRLKKSVVINRSKTVEEAIKSIDLELLKRAITHTCYLEYYSEYQDAVNFFKDNRYKEAYYLATSALYKALGVYCGEHGKPQTKQKWYYKVFEDLVGNDHKLVNKYWASQSIENLNQISQKVEEILQLSQVIILRKVD
ncbi:hypothetical protein T458_24455 [Brevibacillus panacihumi W25]|uniref:Polymerase nucleotidyl transferase domain-containing protein n=1 Tax=Brevibacillus panacihumi W25 TaxID=1408254 RepID=V6M1F5_9BACL|nr:hypothetical protein [Brevibacillus panacihumi]EST52172.1 hypothetical protein T458_24455 [Brevibacillus panacihumi W25]